MNLFALIFFATTALAGESPLCLPDNPASKLPLELSAEEILTKKGVGEKEFFVRLIFSESLASNCLEGSEADATVQKIAWVLRNRLNTPKGKRLGFKIVTAPKQFRSTFGKYDVSRREQFLCPSAAGPKWIELYKKSEAAWDATNDSTKNPLPGVFNYYLSQHFKNSKLKIAPPPWANPTKKVGDTQCVQFFRR